MQYHLIDLGRLDKATAAIADKAFQNWRNIFKAEKESRNLTLNEDDFWDARIIAVIMDENEVVGSHIYNVYDFRTQAPKAHSYIKNFTDLKIQELRKKKLIKFMTMEYLCVNPKYRGRTNGFSWAEIIIGLGFQVLLHSEWEAGGGIARQDVKVDQMASKMGAHGIAKITLNNTPCDVMYAARSEVKPNENPLAEDMIQKLWTEVKNSSPFVDLNKKPDQKVA